jgi:WXG100 family type VII secretion target
MMAQQVKAQYEELKKIQDMLSKEANVIASIRTSFGGQLDILRGASNWEGDAATAFYAEMDGKVLPAVERLQRALERFSSDLAQISAKIAAAEQAASSRFTG